MIQPISTLNDRARILQLPGKKKAAGMDRMLTDPEEKSEEESTEVQNTRQNYYRTLEGKKIGNVDSLLLEEPEKPKVDKAQIERNRKMAQNAALMQVIDSLAGAAGMAKNPETAITTPSRFGELGLNAVDNMLNIQDEHKVDLRRFNQRRDQVDQYNTQLQHEVNQFNQGIEVDIASQQYNEALKKEADEKKEKLEKETRERLEKDETKSQYFDLALRMTSAGKPQAAYEFAKLAGLGNEELNRLFGKEEGGLDPKMASLYDQYEYYAQQASDDDYTIQAGERTVKKGSPTWHRDRLMETLGDDFYLIDHQMRRERNKLASEQKQEQRKASSQALSEDPKVQQGLRNSNQFLQKALMTNIIKATDKQTREQAAQQWLDRNTQMLRASGVPEEQIDQYNDQMFQRMLNELKGSAQESPEKEAPVVADKQGPVVDNVNDRSEKAEGSAPSFEEFAEEISKPHMDNFREDTVQTRELLKNVLLGAGELTGRTVNVLTSPIHVLKELFIDLPKQRQRELYEEYIEKQNNSGNVAQN